MSQSLSYRIQLPVHPNAVVFINGVIARDLTGFFWIWLNLRGIYQSTLKAEGCLQVKAGICGPKEIIMVSYWDSQQKLMNFFRGAHHRQMMRFTQLHPQSLCLYNETYQPGQSGKYSHEPQGMALVYGG